MTSSFKPANILLPSEIDMSKWSVVACDQYTSEPEYWYEVEKNTQGSPSSYNVIFPEIYLSQGDMRINSINMKMKEYLNNNLFLEYSDTFFYIKRRLSSGKERKGLIGAIDLEDYSFTAGAKTNVRATEGTVLERIPPRVKIRENAPLEFPHIMILIDDESRTVIEPLEENKDRFEMVYDFELMQNGGHITGYNIDDDSKKMVMAALSKLSSGETFCEKYNLPENTPPLTFAVGDGNHSLATAKTCWENIKKTLTPSEAKNHPARFALCELVNLHDNSLEFEPIHRVMFGVEPEMVFNALCDFYPSSSLSDNGVKKVVCLFNGQKKNIWIDDADNNLVVGSLQDFIDKYLKDNGGEVDYIHGEDVVRTLSARKNNIGFLLPAMEKNELFKTVILDGALPRKTFSMGEANDKRYYLEGKKIL